MPLLTHKTRATARDLLYAVGVLRALRFFRVLRFVRALRASRVLDGVRVVLSAGASGALLPEECACCAEPATHHLAARRRDGSSLLVGYCDECSEHQASSASRGLSLSLSSLLLALVGAAGLPLLAPGLGWLGLSLLAVLLAVLPLLVLLVPVARPRAPHTSRGPAVLWGTENDVLCASPRYAARLAELNGGLQQQPAPIRERTASAWLSAGPVVGVGAACLSFFVYHPLLRVINLGPVPAEVALDGQRLASVDATSNESPSAGAIVRVPAGAHVLSVTSLIDGSALGQIGVEFHSGAVHLFAIGGEGTCFWLETSGYGREQLARPSYQALTSADHFWVLPGGIDTWFAPNPGTADPNARSSGGLLTALRQAPCAEAPQEVRSAP
ncbi:MAG: hypothetical protein ABW061_06185 [Polyangiaceae bacterium]